jgi:hypothetical protein
MNLSCFTRERSLLFLQERSRVLARRWSFRWPEASQRVQDSTQDQPVTDVHDSSSDDDDPQEEQETSIATGRQKRQIRPPQRYGYADLVAYALTVAVDTAV